MREHSLLQRYGGSPKNTWAIITRATDEVGWAYCRELAKRKFNIVMICWNPGKLKNQSEELLDFYGVEVKILQRDLTKGFTTNFYEEILKELHGYDIA